jgi:hypothetical protein
VNFFRAKLARRTTTVKKISSYRSKMNRVLFHSMEIAYWLIGISLNCPFGLLEKLGHNVAVRMLGMEKVLRDRRVLAAV